MQGKSESSKWAMLFYFIPAIYYFGFVIATYHIPGWFPFLLIIPMIWLRPKGIPEGLPIIYCLVCGHYTLPPPILSRRRKCPWMKLIPNHCLKIW